MGSLPVQVRVRGRHFSLRVNSSYNPFGFSAKSKQVNGVYGNNGVAFSYVYRAKRMEDERVSTRCAAYSYEHMIQ